MNVIVSNKKQTVAALLLLILVAMPLWVASVSSQGPEEEAPVGRAEEETIVAPEAPSATLFSYQGQLLDGNGDSISNAAVPMSFKLYDVATGGTACWAEDHTGDNAINVSDGLFHVLLGQLTAVDSACLTNDAYLELVIDSEALSPRELLTSVAHAIEAETVPDGSITTEKLNLTTGDVYLGEAGTGGSSKLRWDDNPSHHWLGYDSSIAPWWMIFTARQNEGFIFRNDQEETLVQIGGSTSSIGKQMKVNGNLTVQGELSPKKVSLDHGTMCVSDSFSMNVNGNYETALYPEVLPMELDADNSVLIWIDGLAKFTGMACGTESAVGVLLNDSDLIWEMNYCADRWFNMNGMRIKQLSAGTYELKIASMAAEAGNLELHNGGGNQTCINYLILGQ